MTKFQEFQAAYRARLPPGSNFTTELAYNAKGYYDYLTKQNLTNVNPYMLLNRDHFLWTTHTWNHIDMYCILSNCTSPDSVTSTVLLDQCLPYSPSKPVCNFTSTAISDLGEPVYPVSGYSPKV